MSRLFVFSLCMWLLCPVFAQGQKVEDLSEEGGLFQIQRTEGSACSVLLKRALPSEGADLGLFFKESSSCRVSLSGPGLQGAKAFGVYPFFRERSLEMVQRKGRWIVDVPLREGRAVLSLRRVFSSPCAGPPPFYTWAMIDKWVKALPKVPQLNVTTIGKSVQGRPLYRIIIEEPGMPEWLKTTVLLTVRQHGGEDTSSYILEGLVDSMLGKGPNPMDLRARLRLRLVIYACVNPDGTYARRRYNAKGVDLNRNWLATGPDSRRQQPEIFAVQSDIERWAAKMPFKFGLDLHTWGGRRYDGGYRYSSNAQQSRVPHTAYLESVKNTKLITRHSPAINRWFENGGTIGMARVEIFRRLKSLMVTLEFSSGHSGLSRTAAQVRAMGAGLVKGIFYTLHQVTIPGVSGKHDWFLSLSKGKLPLVLDDLDSNLQSSRAESSLLYLMDFTTGDFETVSLKETGLSTGKFRPITPIGLTTAAARTGDHLLSTKTGSLVFVGFADPDYSKDVTWSVGVIVP